MTRKILAEFDAVDGPFLAKLRGIDSRLGRWEQSSLASFARVERGISGLMNSASQFRNFTGIIAGGFGASLATGFIDQTTRIRRALKEAGGEGQESFELVFNAANRSLSGMEAFAQATQRMQKALGYRQGFETTVRDLETLNKLLLLGGKTTEERMSTMIQFSQALQSGRLQGEELRALRENAPVEFIRAIAEEAGGTIEDLKELGAQSELTTDVMMRALKSLEEEADRRIGGISLTIGEATTVLRNGALIATEGFDKGLGISRASASGLQYLGQILANSAESAEVFGQAVKVAGGFMAASFAGQRINSAAQGIANVGKSLRAAAIAAEAEYAAARKSVAIADARRIKAIATVDALSKQAATSAALTRANTTAENATNRHTAALVRLRAASIEAEAAQTRLLLSSRLMVGAGNALRSAWAFLGGWPGLILAVGAAFLTMRSNVESASERFQRLTSGTDDAAAAADALREVQSRLNDAIAEAGKASDQSHQRIIANTRAEIAAKAELLRLETQKLQTLQAERQAEIERLKAEVAAVKTPEQRLADLPTASVPLFGMEEFVNQQAVAEMQAQRLLEVTEIYNAEVQDSVDKIAELEANYTLSQITLEGNLALINAANASTETALNTWDGLNNRAVDFWNNLTAAWRAAIEIEKAADGAGDSIAGAAANAGTLAERLGIAARNAWATMVNMATAQRQIETSRVANQYALYGQGRAAFDNNVQGGLAYDPDQYVPPDTKSGGGGGSRGKSQAEKDQEEALRFIESMFTAEERRAKQLQEMLALRESLIKSYGPESELIGQMDEAIKRLQDGISDSDKMAKELFDTISDNIAASIEDWKGWGNLVRSILADLVRAHGVDFFTALLTPGKQTGNSAGTFLGNLLTGQLHGGGNESSRNARSVPAAAFIGAPRFHTGLMPDEFTAILQKGETVLPKGVSPLGGSVAVNINADMRGADPSMKTYLDGRLKQLQSELPSQVVKAVRTAQSQRKL